MNTALSPTEVRRLLQVGASQVSAPIVLGMPHLCMTGLSETWLLKECGHRHWLLLAEAAGRATSDFRGPEGEPVYAAFLSVSVRNAAFDTAREHDRLVFASNLARISPTRFMSQHRLHVNGQAMGEITMISTFVRRAQKRRNHSIVRIDLLDLRHIPIDADAAAREAESVHLRSDTWRNHLGFTRRKADVIDRFMINPCPAQDFNGADFLYFASYQAFIDRAEWSFFGPQKPFLVTRSRDIVYLGNIDPGERVTACLLQFQQRDDDLAHWYLLESEQAGKTIAQIFTTRTIRG